VAEEVTEEHDGAGLWNLVPDARRWLLNEPLGGWDPSKTKWVGVRGGGGHRVVTPIRPGKEEGSWSG